MKIPKELQQIAVKIGEEGGTPILVGGAVRDYLMGRSSKDLDVEVFGLHYNQLIPILKKFGKVSAVGKAFGVLKLSVGGKHLDFSLPRNDRKTGSGHKGFHIQTNPEMTFREAASRRDFTINALGYNLITGEILDEFHGRSDLKKRILRVVDPETFGEDPLRVLRGIQFAARFKLRVTENSLQVFRKLVDSVDELPRERIFRELKKLLMKSRQPSIGLKLSDDIGLVRKLFPELNALHEVAVSTPDWTSVPAWSHTLNVVDEAARLKNGNSESDMTLMLSALCINFDSLDISESSKDKWDISQPDDSASELTRKFLQRMTNEIRLISLTEALVREYCFLKQHFRSQTIKDGWIKRMALRVNITLLVRLAKADFFAGFKKQNRPQRFAFGEWLMGRYYALGLDDSSKYQPLLLGRHLISLGLKPGPEFGRILQEAYDMQLDDKISTLDEALDWAKKQISDSGSKN